MVHPEKTVKQTPSACEGGREEPYQTFEPMKKQILLSLILGIAALNAPAQFTFIHISDMHVSGIPFEDSDTNARYFQCYIKEFAKLVPKPAFVVVSGDVSNVGNQAPDGMYPIVTRYLFPPGLTNPGIGDYFIDSAHTIPVYFVPGNHEYWMALVNPPVSNDTLAYYKKFLTPDTDYAITTDLAVIVFLRSGSDSTITAGNKKGKGLSDGQCAYLRDILHINSSKRKIIVMHHPAVNAIGTNSDGTPFTGVINSPEDCSIANNRNNFLNICDSNHVDIVLNGHEHQNVVAGRNGKVISENGSDSTRYIQTAAAFNRSYRIVTVDPSYVTVSAPMRSCMNTAVYGAPDPLNFSVFPNPASENLTIKCTGRSEVEILNVEGQLLKRFITDDISTIVDLSDLSGGIYIVKAMNRNGIAIRKIIKR
jgi:3',5'-cyclic AMP phosphodiesterase CpdA